MPIPRITPYTGETENLDAMRGFYADVVGLELTMEHDGFLGFRSLDNHTAQLVTSRPDPDAPTPQFGIDVGDAAAVDAMLGRMTGAGHRVVYGPVTEPWGIRRGFVEDPAGTIVSILAHE